MLKKKQQKKTKQKKGYAYYLVGKQQGSVNVKTWTYTIGT